MRGWSRSERKTDPRVRGGTANKKGMVGLGPHPPISLQALWEGLGWEL